MMFNLKKIKFPLFFKKWFRILYIVGLQFAFLACSVSSDLGTKYSQEPVFVGAFGKTQQDAWTMLLQKYVYPESLVHYREWQASKIDRETLREIVIAFGKADKSVMTDSELKSFYINAYNAMTIDLIVSNYDETLGSVGSPYPMERSIRNIQKLDDKIWEQYKWKLSGQIVSLNDIENKLLRPMGDARIHFGIVCASKGCPPLMKKSFEPETVNQDLDLLADAFVNSGRDTTFNVDSNKMKTSRIVEWFTSDFIQHFGSVTAFFVNYAKLEDVDQIQGMKLSYFFYDWTLNEYVAEVQ